MKFLIDTGAFFFVIAVIDFCLARHLVCDQDTNYQSLRLTWASKTNCNQRRGMCSTGLKLQSVKCLVTSDLSHSFPLSLSGRAGRVSKGYCYRLVTKEFWRNEIPDYMIPEMLVGECVQ